MSDDAAQRYDVVVIGGGAAGLSGALVLARARRSVLVIDAGEPRNAPAAAVHGFLSRDGIEPAELAAIARAEVRSYGGHITDGRASSAVRSPNPPNRSGSGGPGHPETRPVRPGGSGFTVTMDDGRHVEARRLLIATGLVDELPDVPGVRERWGRDVLHCPYCHGWEVRDQTIGVLATGPRAVHQAQLFRQLSPDVTFLLHTAPEPTDVEAEQLAARGITTVAGQVESLEVTDDRLTGVRLSDGTVVPLQALVVGPRFTARTAVLGSLGLEPTAHPLGIGELVAADPTGLTAVPGVWVAGNVADLMAQVVAAAEAGARAAAAINADLISDDVECAVAIAEEHRAGAVAIAEEHRADGPEQFDEAFWDERYRSHDALWSGNPNAHLVDQAGGLSPGTALDIGCGEGADAIWLAERGWRVTAVDLSTVALERAAAHAARVGNPVAGRISWVHADLTAWDPGPARYDLICAHYLHLRSEPRQFLFDRLAAAVGPGGTLLIVGHHPSDLQTTMPRPREPDLFFTGDDIAARLGPGGWDIVTNAAVPRTTTDPEGRPVTIHDAVVRARRRP